MLYFTKKCFISCFFTQNWIRPLNCPYNLFFYGYLLFKPILWIGLTKEVLRFSVNHSFATAHQILAIFVGVQILEHFTTVRTYSHGRSLIYPCLFWLPQLHLMTSVPNFALFTHHDNSSMPFWNSIWRVNTPQVYGKAVVYVCGKKHLRLY